jgi:hypothetical protein
MTQARTAAQEVAICRESIIRLESAALKRGGEMVNMSP